MQLFNPNRTTQDTPSLAYHIEDQPNWSLTIADHHPAPAAMIRTSINHATSVPLRDSENRPYRCPPDRTLSIKQKSNLLGLYLNFKS